MRNLGNRTLILIRCLILTDSCYQVVKYKKVEFDSLKKEKNMILDKVNTPDDVKKLSIREMNSLADEMRELIIKKLILLVGTWDLI